MREPSQRGGPATIGLSRLLWRGSPSPGVRAPAVPPRGGLSPDVRPVLAVRLQNAERSAAATDVAGVAGPAGVGVADARPVVERGRRAAGRRAARPHDLRLPRRRSLADHDGPLAGAHGPPAG